jgi:hypothetical protein
MLRRAAASPLRHCPGWPHSGSTEPRNLGDSPVPLWLWVLTVITYSWVLANLLLLVLPSGKPAHDRLAGTVVVRAPT